MYVFYSGDAALIKLSKAFETNTSLTKVNMYRNNIGNSGVRRLCSALQKNKSITSISLQSNNISILPYAFAFLTRLKIIWLRNNPLRSPPSFIGEDSSRLLEYFADLRVGAVRLNQLQLMFLGHGGVGKSTLKKSLRSIEEKNSLNVIQQAILQKSKYVCMHIDTFTAEQY